MAKTTKALTLSAFLKENKVNLRENTTFPVTKSFCDAEGEPLAWVIRPLSTDTIENIRTQCTREVPVKGKANVYRATVDSSQYISELLAASVVEPNLHSAELQDSYGVKTAATLLRQLVDVPGEYTAFMEYVQELNGLDKSQQEEIDEAKN